MFESNKFSNSARLRDIYETDKIRKRTKEWMAYEKPHLYVQKTPRSSEKCCSNPIEEILNFLLCRY